MKMILALATLALILGCGKPSTAPATPPEQPPQIVYERHGDVELWEDTWRNITCYRIQGSGIACAAGASIRVRFTKRGD